MVTSTTASTMSVTALNTTEDTANRATGTVTSTWTAAAFNRTGDTLNVAMADGASNSARESVDAQTKWDFRSPIFHTG